MINTHNGIREKDIKPINIDNYPAIKKHLDKFYPQLEKRADKGITPYNLRNCAYMDDFLRPKIVYPDIMRMPSQNTLLTEYPYFYLDINGFFVEATNFILSGNDLDLLCAYLASDLGFFLFAKFYTGPQFDDTGFRYKKDYLQNLLVPSFSIFDVSELRKLYEFVAQRNDNQDQLSQHRSRIDKIFMDGIGLTPEEALYVKSFKENLIKEKNRKR